MDQTGDLVQDVARKVETTTSIAEETIAQLKSDPHAPAAFRVNGVVVHMPSFYAAFEVKPGSAMYLAPEQRIRLW